MELSELAREIERETDYLLDATERQDYIKALLELASYYVGWHDVDNFKCMDCDWSTFWGNEYYMLEDEVWQQVNPGGEGMLCIGCVEKRLGRELVRADFNDAPVNELGESEKSERLKDRLSRV